MDCKKDRRDIDVDEFVKRLDSLSRLLDWGLAIALICSGVLISHFIYLIYLGVRS